jgi:heme/copper-type cytochrome/quinol oxidase subunit 3
MTIVYAILESPHRWAILAGIAATSGLVGAMAILAWDWSVWLARVWVLAGLVVAAYFMVRLVLEWKEQVDEGAEAGTRDRKLKTEN